MNITPFRRHLPDCPHTENPYHPRCGCPIYGRFVWKGEPTVFEGKKLAYQNKWGLDTRIWSEGGTKAEELAKRLEDFAAGIAPTTGKTVKDAVREWLEFRTKHGKGITKADLMGRKLLDWCQQNGILMLSAITTDGAMRFRTSLPFRTGDSGSLSVHWSVISGFFNWCVGMGYIEKSPIPDPKLFPQFAIEFDKPEVKVPTKKQIRAVLKAATGRIKLLLQLMHETGMALVDALLFDPTKLIDKTLIRGRRKKTGESFRVRISSGLAERLRKAGSPLFEGTYSKWREDCYKVFREAKVEMTPHGFRHYFISQWLAHGVRVEDVSDMVGTSPREIRKTYRHWIKEAEDRMDKVQREAWRRMGLDDNGNGGD